MGHQNSKKHKAMHGGYRDKPSQGAIKALCNMYQAIGEIKFSDTEEKASLPPGTQLSLNL
jgi:hypothetical protein